MKFVATPQIITATSSFVLVLLSSAIIYWYVSSVRPELIDSKAIEKKNDQKVKNINQSREKLVSESANLGRFGILSDINIISKLPKTLDYGKVAKVPDNPIDKFFKIIQSKADEVLAREDNDKNSSEDSAPTAHIETIKFPSELGKSQTLLKELQTDNNNKLTDASNAVVISQVGLSLRTKKLFAAVYRIQNLFGVSGKIGHLFVAVGREGIDHQYNLGDAKINFGSDKELLDSFDSKYTISKPDDSDYILHIFKNNNKIVDEDIEAAMMPYTKGHQYINHYRWLYESSKLEPSINSSDTIIGLIYSKEGEIPVHYPADVRLFDVTSMKLSDATLHSGGLKRIQNHCRDYILSDELKNLK